MNLFYLSESPQECAEFHCDRHVVKQITEQFQMLTSALLRHGANPDQLPKTKSGSSPKGGYPNHPVTKWHGDSYFNFMKGAEIGLALCKEYTKRYGKTHFCEAGIKFMQDNAKSLAPNFLSSTPYGMTPYAVAINEACNCRKLPFFDKLHPIDQYRCYYILDKAEIITYKFTQPPYWLNQDYVDWLGEEWPK